MNRAWTRDHQKALIFTAKDLSYRTTTFANDLSGAFCHRGLQFNFSGRGHRCEALNIKVFKFVSEDGLHFLHE